MITIELASRQKRHKDIRPESELILLPKLVGSIKNRTYRVITPSESLTSRLVGSATLQGLQTGLDPFDIGIGLARAPQI
ncbi:hypothetical protein [Nitrosomonas sp. Is37]|uniref:hypothetical protein n=1 Tax=Nitrosomonas sp. Is37 TaxID=3080535 RepID=UPI00294B84CF|nr:hypothetical protein [Nitrosomonas sp. Is37]